MNLPREPYIPPVGFAREPAKERRRWFGRITLFVLIAFLAWLLFTHVINPPPDNPFSPGEQITLPAPV